MCYAIQVVFSEKFLYVRFIVFTDTFRHPHIGFEIEPSTVRDTLALSLFVRLR